MEAPNVLKDTITGPSATRERPVLEPLSLTHFNQQSRGDNSEEAILPSLTPCVLCEKEFNTSRSDEKKACLEHLLTAHNLVIGEVEIIEDIKGYFKYWKERFKQQALTDFCTAFDTAPKGKATRESSSNLSNKTRYFLLCDVLPEDKDLRQFQQQQKLTKVLQCQQEERHGEGFSRDCLFCREHFTGRRSELINHMAVDHSFNIGQPDNLVFVDEFLDILQTKLNNLLCLYCEKIFKDRFTLKEHMRKKQHRRINSKNPVYDKFYIINYLEMGKNWELIQSEDDEEDEDDSNQSEEDSCEWQEDPSAQAMCLFCEFSSSSADKLQNHMNELHDFDLESIRRERSLGFYQQVKLINYIRRQIHQCLCYGCCGQFSSKPELLDHMHAENHIVCLPQESDWDQPQYYFPTYENDNLLCQLNDCEEDSVTTEGGPLISENSECVIPEDCSSMENLISKLHL